MQISRFKAVLVTIIVDITIFVLIFSIDLYHGFVSDGSIVYYSILGSVIPFIIYYLDGDLDKKSRLIKGIISFLVFAIISAALALFTFIYMVM